MEFAARSGPILDLACGGGRNGLSLIESTIPVVFADINPEALAQVQLALAQDSYAEKKQLATLWPVDFERPGTNPFEDRRFGGLLVFNYLFRPLFDDIKRVVLPGGIVLYQTFTLQQAQLGRPKNPDFLLKPGELCGYFSDWDVLHYFEGVVENDGGGGSKAIAQLAARKPTVS